jgi:dihydrofolate reductase
MAKCRSCPRCRNGQKHCIGKGNALPWHISADLKHFKEITQGGVVIMGRKTLESMGRALPNRVNWVITRDINWHFDGVKIAYSIEDALNAALEDVKTPKSKLYSLLVVVKSLSKPCQLQTVLSSLMLT